MVLIHVNGYRKGSQGVNEGKGTSSRIPTVQVDIICTLIKELKNEKTKNLKLDCMSQRFYICRF